MKRILALFALSLGCSSAMASDTINFEGTVTAGGTCPISVVTPGGPALPKIYLGDFKVEDYANAGLKTQLERFALRVDPATCSIDPGDKATVKFQAHFGGDAAAKLFGMRSGGGYSTGFGLAIFDKSNTQLAPDAESVEYELSDSVPTDMNFSTQLHTTAAVTEGHIATSVGFLVAIP
ncbi:fimbrial protein [Pseudomonas pudica]|uniref:fimbrial protein n=1 Tax=Pseudomonas TaxID=286 RepID=UPI000A1D7B8F|nr:fimbrial protein [Pseudomonas sp. B10(2017)]